MQFDYSHKAGDKARVKFLPHKVTGNALATVIECLLRIGGEMQEDVSTWVFPMPTFAGTISQIIANTCFECGGLMKDSTAFQNTVVSFDDFGNDAGQRGTTQLRVGPAVQIKVRKCSVCGHSHT